MENTAAGRDVRRAEEKIARHVKAYQRARKALEYLEAGKRVMDKYRPSTLKILPSVEMWLKSKGWGRGMNTLAWFWCIGTMNDEQGNEWMDECE